MVDTDEHDWSAEADGFDSDEVRTSPEGGRSLAGPRRLRRREGEDPRVLVAHSDPNAAAALAALLSRDGWSADTAPDADALIERATETAPDVVLIDNALQVPGVLSMPEALRAQCPDVPLRVVALLAPHMGDDAVATAIADGYDDFIGDSTRTMELLSRATANLRAARNMALLERQKLDASILQELSQALASSLNLHLILHTVSRRIADVIALDRCSIIIIDPDRPEAMMVAASEDRRVRDLRIQIASYPEVERCIATAAPVIIQDTLADPLLQDVREQVQKQGVRTMALFPIVFEARVIGVLFLRSTELGHQLSDHDIQFAQTVASSCAVAIRNARLFSSYRDENERMNSMRILAERRMEALKKFEHFFEYAADGMAVVDADGQFLYINRVGARLLGHERDALSDRTFPSLLAPDTVGAWERLLEEMRRDEWQENRDFYVLTPDGSERVFSVGAAGAGQDTGLLILSFRDVTEMREMEIELRTTKDFLENLIDNSPDAIVASDMNGTIILFNKGAEEILGYRAEHIVGQMRVSDLYPDGGDRRIMAELRSSADGGRGRLTPRPKDLVADGGQVVPVKMTASIIYEDGEEVATVGVFADLREQLSMQRQLDEAQEALMHTEKARVAAELAGMAAHELNQPLTSVLGYAEMLMRRVPSEDRRLRRPVDIIFREAERIAGIVRKIGRVTRYETKHYGASTMMMDLDRASAPVDKPRASHHAQAHAHARPHVQARAPATTPMRAPEDTTRKLRAASGEGHGVSMPVPTDPAMAAALAGTGSGPSAAARAGLGGRTPLHGLPAAQGRPMHAAAMPPGAPINSTAHPPGHSTGQHGGAIHRAPAEPLHGMSAPRARTPFVATPAYLESPTRDEVNPFIPPPRQGTERSTGAVHARPLANVARPLEGPPSAPISGPVPAAPGQPPRGGGAVVRTDTMDPAILARIERRRKRRNTSELTTAELTNPAGAASQAGTPPGDGRSGEPSTNGSRADGPRDGSGEG